MRLTGSRAYYRPTPPKMPPGLVELMEGLTREVLKHNPSDIHGFCASHMEQLLEKRDGPSLKKSLTLEQKITRAQERVRQRAEVRRQEYDKNAIPIEEQKSASENDAKDDVKSSQQPASVHINEVNIAPNKDTPADVHVNDINSAPNKDSMLSVHDKVAQNIMKTPVRQEQVLESLAEMEFSQSDLGVSEPKEDVTVDKVDEEGGIKLDKILSREKLENVVVTESNSEPFVTKIEKVFSVNTNPLLADAEVVNTKPHDEIALETSKSPFATDLKENQQKPINDEVHVENNVSVDEIKEANAGKPAAVTDAEHKNAITVCQIADDTPKSYNDGQVVEVHEADVTKEVHEVSEAYEPDRVNEAHTNVEQIQHTEQVPPLGNFEVMHQLNDVTDSQTPSDIVKIDSIADDHIKNDPTLPIPKVNNDDINYVSKNGTEIPPETDTDNPQSKCDDGYPFNNDANNGEACGIPEQFENKNLNLKDNGNKTDKPLTETDVYVDSLATGADTDILTLVTEESGNDIHDDKVLELNNSLESKSEIYIENAGKLNSDTSHPGNIKDEHDDIDGKNNSSHKTNENDDTNQVKMLPSVNESDTTDNQENNMNLETAAVTIQKVFRNFLFKNRGSTFENTSNDDGNFLDEDDKNKEEYDFSIANSLSTDRRAHGISRMDTVLQTVNEEKSLSLSTDDSSTLSSAATTIQAHVRGYLVRNKLNSNKTVSTNSIPTSNSNEPSLTSLEINNGNDQIKNKTVLNIHIVPEGDNYLSRDESLITSMDLSLDSSPPSSINLHPLGYNKSERRKQLKREDAIQSVSPPSNNSGKLSDDFDSVKELSLNDHDATEQNLLSEINRTSEILDKGNGKNNALENASLEYTSKGVEIKDSDVEDYDDNLQKKIKRDSLSGISSDEMDVVTPITFNEDLSSSSLMHSGEFHDVVLPTRVSRSDTTVVSDFKNVLVYFLLWNDSY